MMELSPDESVFTTLKTVVVGSHKSKSEIAALTLYIILTARLTPKVLCATVVVTIRQNSYVF